MGGKVERYIVPVVIGFTPFILLALTWAPNGRTAMQRLLLGLYLPLIAMELFVAAVAFREGMIRAFRRLSWPAIPTAALAVLVAVAIITAIRAPNPRAAELWTCYWLLHLLFGYSVAHLCRRTFEGRDLVLAYLIGFAAFVAGAILFATQVSDPAFDWTHGWPAATHIRHFGYYATAMIALCIGLSASERRLWRLLALFLFTTASFAFSLWTGSRGTVIGVGGAIVVGLIAVPQMRRAVVWGGTALSLAVGALLASLFPAPGLLMGLGRTVTQTVGSSDITTGRAQIWRNVIGAIEKRPLFGYGENQMATVAPFGTIGQTHDVIFQVLLAWGVVGLACVAVLAVWFLLRSLAVARRAGADALPAFMAMLALGSLAMIDGSLFHVLPLGIFAACAGMVASQWPPRSVETTAVVG